MKAQLAGIQAAALMIVVTDLLLLSAVIDGPALLINR
jgi:hypothetical protein